MCTPIQLMQMKGATNLTACCNSLQHGFIGQNHGGCLRKQGSMTLPELLMGVVWIIMWRMQSTFHLLVFKGQLHPGLQDEMASIRKIFWRVSMEEVTMLP
jgi:hypothetical protein